MEKNKAFIVFIILFLAILIIVLVFKFSSMNGGSNVDLAGNTIDVSSIGYTYIIYDSDENYPISFENCEGYRNDCNTIISDMYDADWNTSVEIDRLDYYVNYSVPDNFSNATLVVKSNNQRIQKIRCWVVNSLSGYWYLIGDSQRDGLVNITIPPVCFLDNKLSLFFELDRYRRSIVFYEEKVVYKIPTGLTNTTTNVSIGNFTLNITNSTVNVNITNTTTNVSIGNFTLNITNSTTNINITNTTTNVSIGNFTNNLTNST